MVIVHGSRLVSLCNWLDHLGHERPLNKVHSGLMLIIFTASLVLLKHILSECVRLLAPVLDESVPVWILRQAPLVAHDEQEVLGSRDCHVHASVVAQEA